MNKRLLMCALMSALLGTAPAVAQAADERYNAVDVFFSGGTIEPSGSSELGGRGGGMRIQIGATPWVFATLQAEHIPTKLEFADGTTRELDADDVRFGVGARWTIHPKISTYLRGEVLSLKNELTEPSGTRTEFKDTGLAGHLGIELHALSFLGFYGEGGLVTAGDLQGIEFTVGLESVETTVGSFIEYRYTDLEDDNDAGIEYSITRGGLRIRFD